MLTLDFETYWSKEYTLSKLTPEQYVHDSRFEVIGFGLKQDNKPARWWSGSDAELRNALEKLRPVIERSAVLMHNAIFDGTVLAMHYGIIPGMYVDSMFMARPWVTPYTGRASLASVVQHLGLPAKGTQLQTYQGFTRKMFSQQQLADYGEYCCHDVELSHQIYQLLKDKFPDDEFKTMDRVVRMYTQPMFKLNANVLAEHLHAVKAKKQQLIQSAGLDNRDKLMSNPQLAEMLQSYGVDPPTKISPTTGNETWAFAKNDPEFKALLDHPDERVQVLATARIGVKSTLEETRTQRFLTHALTSRPFPIPLLYYGAHTGRFSGLLKLNCQNLPRGGQLRASMEAPPGYVVLAVDSRQIEARLTAWVAEQTDLVEQFANHEDVYANFASRGIYGYKVTEATHPHERRVGKVGILSLGYGAGPPKFNWMLQSEGIIMTEDEAKQVVYAYRNMYARIPALWQRASIALFHQIDSMKGVAEIGPCVMVDGSLHLPTGMQITYADLQQVGRELQYKFGKRVRKIYGAKLVENMIQALAFLIIKWQLNLVPRKWHFAMQAHDELVFIVKESEADEALRVILDIMKQLPPWATGLPLDASGGYGPNYKEAK